MDDTPQSARDSAHMRRALGNAVRGWGQTAPNPLVGAVVVSGNTVVADGWHARYGDPHAEVMALAAARERARGATLYVTLEPCTHHGKTPPCVDAIIAAGIGRVVVATADPNPVAGGGVAALRAAGIAVDVGVERAPACELNAPFFNAFASTHPWVTLKLALSADGSLSDPTGQRRWITGESARRHVHRMRAGVDAVAVGIGTVLADDPLLTVRDSEAPRRQPTRVVFDSALRTPLTSQLVRGAREVPTIIVAREDQSAGADALRAAGVRIIVAADLAHALISLRQNDIQSILVEAGYGLTDSFLREKAADRVAIFQSQVTLGPGAKPAFAEGAGTWLKALPVVDRRTFGEDTLITYAVREVPCSPA